MCPAKPEKFKLPMPLVNNIHRAEMTA